MRVVTDLIDLVRKIIPYDTKLKVYKNGIDNAYPDLMEAFKNMSVTATMSSRLMQQMVCGKGFSEEINEKLIAGESVIDIISDVGRNIVDERGVFVKVDYNANFDISRIKVLPFKKCKLGFKDSNEFNGKIYFYHDWTQKVDESKVVVYDVFNPKPEAIKAQMKAQNVKDIRKYRGQIFYFNMDRQFVYPLSRIDSVYKECHNEDLSATYKNRTLEFGFFGKTAVFTRPLIESKYYNDPSDAGIKLLKELTSEREEFKQNLKEFIGSEKTGGVMHFEVDFAGEKLEDALVIKNIESNINDKLFEYTETSAEKKIRMAYNALPKILIDSSDNSIFGASGEAIKGAKITYQENTTIERVCVQQIMNKLLKYTAGFKWEKTEKIVPLIDVPVEPVEPVTPVE